jgi:hypothetical protein
MNLVPLEITFVRSNGNGSGGTNSCEIKIAPVFEFLALAIVKKQLLQKGACKGH